jgi:predicted ATPase
MHELDSITIRGFRSIAECESLRLAPLNIVIGPNGAGKSNFIGVFSFLSAICEGRLQDYVGKAGGAERILHFGSKATKELFLRVSFENGVNQYEITLAPTATDELIPISETANYWNKGKFPNKPYDESISRSGKEAGISDPRSAGRVATYVRSRLSRWKLYHFHDTGPSSAMKKTSDLHDNAFLRPDGSNIASFLYYLREEHENEYSLIRRTIQRVAPFFEDFELSPSKLNPDKIRLEWRHTRSDAYFDASSLSDGTLRFIALCTLFLQPLKYRPSVILVDEPELGLHPFAITMFASLVRQASIETQVIVSTQSPLLLDHFEPQDVVVTDLIDGGTQFTRLATDKLETWLLDYSLGQLWEKNELGGRPGGMVR